MDPSARVDPSTNMEPGTILTDSRLHKWAIGARTGSKHLGKVYTCWKVGGKGSGQYVIKVDTKSSTSLFVEQAFYTRVAKPAMIELFMRKKGLKYLGIPKYYGGGVQPSTGAIQPIRFLVIEKLGENIAHISKLKYDHLYPERLTKRLAIGILNALEYMHEHKYVHGNITPQNIMTGASCEDRYYLKDYHLAFRFLVDEVHVPYTESKGTTGGMVLFKSIDQHMGALPSRRGDMQSLVYNLIYIQTHRLPWSYSERPNESDIEHKTRGLRILKQKRKYSEHPEKFRKWLEERGVAHDWLLAIMYMAFNLKYQELPDYYKLREIISLDAAPIDDRYNVNLHSVKKHKRKATITAAMEQVISQKAKRPRKHIKCYSKEEADEDVIESDQDAEWLGSSGGSFVISPIAKARPKFQKRVTFVLPGDIKNPQKKCVLSSQHKALKSPLLHQKSNRFVCNWTGIPTCGKHDIHPRRSGRARKLHDDSYVDDQYIWSTFANSLRRRGYVPSRATS